MQNNCSPAAMRRATAAASTQHRCRLDEPNPDHDLCPVALGRGLSRSEQKPISVLRSIIVVDFKVSPVVRSLSDAFLATRHGRARAHFTKKGRRESFSPSRSSLGVTGSVPNAPTLLGASQGEAKMMKTLAFITTLSWASAP